MIFISKVCKEAYTVFFMEIYDIWIQNGESGVTRVDKNNVTVFNMHDEPTLLAENKYDIWIGDE